MNAIDLREKAAATVAAEARAKLEALSDDASEEECRAVEAEVDAALAELDRINARSDKLDRLEGHEAALAAVDKARRPVGENKTVTVFGSAPAPDAPCGLRSDQSYVEHIERRGVSYGREFAQLGLGKYLRSMVLGARTDLELVLCPRVRMGPVVTRCRMSCPRA